MSQEAWARWVPRPEDYWPTFTAPYRKLLTELVSKHTPVEGRLIDFGCGIGVQTLLLRLARPDLFLYAIDCNPQARNLTQVLLGQDPLLKVADTPVLVEDVPEVDTVLTVYTLCYIDPGAIATMLTALSQKAKTLIIAEPTCVHEEAHLHAFAGMPMGGHLYPYGAWLAMLGREVETIEVPGPGHLNAITLATHAAP
jgi:hypothetical protein